MIPTDFSKMLIPEHPHRRLHILLSILAITLVAGSIFFFNKQKVDMIVTQPTKEDHTIENLRAIDASVKKRGEIPEEETLRLLKLIDTANKEALKK